MMHDPQDVHSWSRLYREETLQEAQEPESVDHPGTLGEGRKAPIPETHDRPDPDHLLLASFSLGSLPGRP